MEPEQITISKTKFDELIERDRFLMCLEGAGVDNWEGYDLACENFLETYPEYNPEQEEDEEDEEAEVENKLPTTDDLYKDDIN